MSILLLGEPVPDLKHDVATVPPLQTALRPVVQVGEPQADILAETRRCEIVVDREAVAELRAGDPRTAVRLDAALTEMPRVGDVFQGFTLVLELGRGAFGRVFLARQKVLANRLVALKIAADLQGESQNLAQLQHTNIVPIYSEHRSGHLHAVCMPYFGSTTLADVCKSLSAQQSLPTSGKQIVSTMCNRQSTVRSAGEMSQASSRPHSKADLDLGRLTPTNALALHATSANLTRIEQMSYVDVVLWMASRLADGLAHAHERGIIHRDLKPANVLLCDDGQPMLLDFNLAEDIKSRVGFAVAQMGGTPPYMSPEQLIVYRDGVGRVDERGDLYALGLIIYHLLTGRHAFPTRRGASADILPKLIADRQGPPPAARCFNSAISPAVESIVRHCLEPDPARRYASARDLAEDIERQRANRPLRYAPEPSLLERTGKWGRRHPRLTSPASLSAVAAAIVLGVAAVSVHLSLQSRARDQDSRQQARHEYVLANYYERFLPEFHLAQDLLTTDDPVEINRGLKHGEAALRHYDVTEQAEWLDEPLAKELPSNERARLQGEVGAIAFLMAQAVHFQPETNNGQAKQMNQLAESHLDQNAQPALAQQRVAIQHNQISPEDRLRLRQLLDNAAGLSAIGRFLLASEHAAQGRHQEALRIADGVVVERPDDFGAWFLKARCHQLLDQGLEAIAAYGTAIALRPNYPRSYLYRAAVLSSQLERVPQALQDLNRALKLQPNFLEARIDRGLIYIGLHKCPEALQDLDWALQRDEVPTRVWFMRSRVRAMMNDLTGAELDRQKGLRAEPADPLSWVCRGMAKMHDDVDGALADFIQAEHLYPRCLEALENQVYVYAALRNKPDEALAVYDRLLSHYPDNPRAIGHRAILLARTGRFDEAVALARELVKSGPKPEHLYRAACALAIASEKAPALRAESLRWLAQALTRGFGHELLERDSDLKALRGTPEFKHLLGSSRMTQAANISLTPPN